MTNKQLLANYYAAYFFSNYKIPRLAIYAPLWLNVIIPFVIEHSPKDGKLACFAAYNKIHFAQGWTIGDENPFNLPLNKSVFDENDMEMTHWREICKDLTNNLEIRHTVSWFGDIKDILLCL